MTDVALRILLQTAGGAGVIGAINGIASSLGKGGLGGSLLAVGAAAAGAAVAIGVQSVQAFTNYQSALVQLQNTTGSSDSQMKQYASTIRQLSDTTGKAQTDLMSGMYQIISANFAGADATRILTTATQSSIIANANQTQVTTGLVVTLNAFGLKASQVDTVSNQMFKTMSLGRGSMSDLAGALQTGASLVAHYGVSVKDMDATLATLSTGGMKTFGTSMTGLTQLLNVMDGKTDLVAKRLHSLGIPFDEAKFKAMSFTQQIAYLNNAFKGHEQQMVSVLGSKQAATALGILGSHAKLLSNNIKQLGDTQALAQQKSDAWARTQQTAAFQMQLFQTHVQNLMIDLGAQLLPIINNAMSGIQNLAAWVGTVAGNFVTWLQKSGLLQDALNLVKGAVQDAWNVIQGAITVVQNIYNWFVKWHTPILAVAGAITLFFLPALIKSGVEAAISGGKIGASFISNLIKTGAESIINGAKVTASFVASMVKSGVEAVVNGAKITASFVASLIKTGLEGWAAAGKLGIFIGQLVATGAKAAWSAAVMAGKFIWSLIQSGVEAAKTAAVFMAKMIPALISMAADGIVAVVGAMPALIGGLIGATGAAWGFTAALLANPITWIVLAIIVLIGIIILLATHWKQVTAAIGAAFSWLGTHVHAIVTAIGNFFSWLGSQIHARIMFIAAVFLILRARAQMIVLGIINWFKQLPENVVKFVISMVDGAVARFTEFKDKLINIFHAVVKGIGDAFSGLGTLVHNGIQKAADAVKSVVNWIIGGINNFINFLDNLSIGIPKIDVGPVHIGGGSIHLPHIPDIPLLAAGGNVTVGGLSVVGDRGPELLNLPAGAQVVPLSGGSRQTRVQSGHTFNIYLSTMARSVSEVRALVDLLEQELGRRVRAQTPGYNQSNVF